MPYPENNTRKRNKIPMIWKRKSKALFSNNMIICVKILENLRKRLLELSEFSKIIGYKVNVKTINYISL